MAERMYNKFTVIKNEDMEKYLSDSEKELLNNIILRIAIGRDRDRKVAENTYYVVNTDEPYAEEILQLILKGEDEKQNPKKDCIEEECEHYEPNHPNHFCTLPVREKCPHGCSLN